MLKMPKETFFNHPIPFLRNPTGVCGTDGLTDGRTDTPSYRFARTHLKNKAVHSFTSLLKMSQSISFIVDLLSGLWSMGITPK